MRIWLVSGQPRVSVSSFSFSAKSRQLLIYPFVLFIAFYLQSLSGFILGVQEMPPKKGKKSDKKKEIKLSEEVKNYKPVKLQPYKPIVVNVTFKVRSRSTEFLICHDS